ncbi:MAG: hypothetical protein ACP5MD_12910, partial [Verrucomicrobiia bacterium]
MLATLQNTFAAWLAITCFTVSERLGLPSANQISAWVSNSTFMTCNHENRAAESDDKVTGSLFVMDTLVKGGAHRNRYNKELLSA